MIFFLPPPGFRIRSFGVSVPLTISSIPVITVWGWHPSTQPIYFCPPCPNLIASMPAYCLLFFSFKVSKNALIFCSISSEYFMCGNYLIPLLFRYYIVMILYINCYKTRSYLLAIPKLCNSALVSAYQL